MMTLECMDRGFGAMLARGAAVGFERDAECGVVLGWKEPAAAKVRERLERRGREREEKRWKVLENRMVVVGRYGEGERRKGNRMR